MEKKDTFLLKIRNEQDVSQNQLAKYMGVSQVTILRWETGKSSISPENAVKLGEFFKVPAENFCTEADPAKKTSPLEDMFQKLKIIDEKTGYLMTSKRLTILLPIEKDSFGVMVKTDAMETEYDAQRSIPKGAIAVVNPTPSMQDWNNMKSRVVYGSFDGKNFMLKELCKDGDQYFLRAWNRSYPAITDMTNFQIRGFVVGYFIPI